MLSFRAPFLKFKVLIYVSQTATLFAQCMHEKLPRPDGIPSEVRTWSDFVGGKEML